MKLLRKDMSLKEFHGNQFHYAILSHTWGEKEFTYEELRRHEKKADRTVEASPGYRKIVNFAATASSDGFEHFWADTCCIDQRNSSELYEAINSMFSWYRNAGVCYIYLEDFEWSSNEMKTLKQDKNKNNDWVARFEQCRWFSRAWTLQELLAPNKLEFVDRNWVRFSSLVDEDILYCVIEARTNIPAAILRKEKTLRDINIATKMCWAAGRNATRPEDIAYSLLGVFNVNLPLTYGEGGEKAFERLQKEIIANSADDSVLAWSGCGDFLGLLAKSPDQFQDCSNMKKVDSLTNIPWTFVNAGLQVSLSMARNDDPHLIGYTVYLNCVDPKNGLCPSFTLFQIAEREYARSGDLDVEYFPLTEAATLRREVVVRQSPKLLAPAIKFDCFSVSRTLVDWDIWWPGSAHWRMGKTFAVCERPALDRNANGYMAISSLKDRTVPDNTYLVAVSLDWDVAHGKWKCAPRVHKQGTKDGWKRPSDSTGTPLENGVVSYIWQTSRNYDIQATIPKWVEWYHEGPISVLVSVRRTDEPDLGNISLSNPTSDSIGPDQMPQSLQSRMEDHELVVKNFRKYMRAAQGGKVHGLREKIAAKLAQHSAEAMPHEVMESDNQIDQEEQNGGVETQEDETGCESDVKTEATMQMDSAANAAHDDWEFVDPETDILVLD